jgi:hypothetical protein
MPIYDRPGDVADGRVGEAELTLGRVFAKPRPCSLTTQSPTGAR